MLVTLSYGESWHLKSLQVSITRKCHNQTPHTVIYILVTVWMYVLAYLAWCLMLTLLMFVLRKSRLFEALAVTRLMWWLKFKGTKVLCMVDRVRNLSVHNIIRIFNWPTIYGYVQDLTFGVIKFLIMPFTALVYLDHLFILQMSSWPWNSK